MLKIIRCSVKKNHRDLLNYDEFIVYDKLVNYYQQGKANVWIALEADKMVGYAQFFLNEKGRVHLNEIAVSENYQHKGIGSKLLNAVESSSLEWKAEIIELFCDESNEEAKKFYGKNKFETEKRLLIKRI